MNTRITAAGTITATTIANTDFPPTNGAQEIFWRPRFSFFVIPASVLYSLLLIAQAHGLP